MIVIVLTNKEVKTRPLEKYLTHASTKPLSRKTMQKQNVNINKYTEVTKGTKQIQELIKTIKLKSSLEGLREKLQGTEEIVSKL